MNECRQTIALIHYLHKHFECVRALGEAKAAKVFMFSTLRDVKVQIQTKLFKSTPSLLITHTGNFFCRSKKVSSTVDCIRDKIRAALHSVRQRGSVKGPAGVQPLAAAAQTRARQERLPQLAKKVARALRIYSLWGNKKTAIDG